MLSPLLHEVRGVDEVHPRSELQVDDILLYPLTDCVHGTLGGLGDCVGCPVLQDVGSRRGAHSIEVGALSEARANVLGTLTEGALGNVESLDAVHVIDGKVSLVYLVADEYRLYGALDTLGAESRHSNIQAGALLDDMTAYLDVIEEFEAYTGALDALDVLINDGLDKAALVSILADGVEIAG